MSERTGNKEEGTVSNKTNPEQLLYNLFNSSIYIKIHVFFPSFYCKSFHLFNTINIGLKSMVLIYKHVGDKIYTSHYPLITIFHVFCSI